MAMPQLLALLVLPLCVALDAMRMPAAKPVPITVFSGFLGAGKTTLLERCLSNSAGLTIGCVVNDVAALNVDGLVARGASPDADGVVTMSNGCACCTGRDGLVEGIVALQRAAAARGGRWDHIVVEATGIAEPSSLRDALATRLPRAAGAALDSLVTVVDAAEFAGLWGSGDRLADRRELGLGGLASVYDLVATAGVWRPVADLLAEQVECADLVVLNKCDLAGENGAAAAAAAAAALNPAAAAVRTVRCDVALEAALGFAGGAGAAAARRPACLGDAAARPAHFAAATHVYERRRPFAPERLAAALEDGGVLEGVLRSKGFCWLASSDADAFYWSHAGAAFEASATAPWWRVGDGERRTALAFIGAGGVDAARIDAALDACLLEDREWGLYNATGDDEQRGWNFGTPDVFYARRVGQRPPP